ncbi:MAG: FGGY-family carbohydrate kinase [Chloroflexota bacterium]
MSQKYLLGIDNGTTVTKAALFDLQGRTLAVGSSQEVKVVHPQPGWAEQNMDEIWQATATAIRQCLEQAKIDPAEVAGLSFSGHGGGVWLLDEAGRPVRNAIIWLDGRAKPYLDRWTEDGRFTQIYDESGWSLFPGIGPCAIFPWLMDHEPDSLDKARVNLSSKDWVKYCLTGEFSVDLTMASIAHMNFKTRDYSEQVMELTGISRYRSLFSPIVAPWEVAGYVTAKAAGQTGLKQGTPVAAGAWDGTSSALGAGSVGVGEAASVIGTSGVHVVVSDKADLDPDRIYSLMYHTVPDHYIKNSLSMLGAGNLNWFEREFCLAEREEAQERGGSVYDVINEEVANIPIGAGGIIYLPFLQGERAPFVLPEARGVFFGLGDWHKRGHLLRAVYEGVALSMRHNYEAMQRGAALKTTYLTGGGSNSAVWCQIMADCTGNMMRIASGAELGARGAAINAGVAVGLFPDHKTAVQQMVGIEREYTPQLDHKARYDKLFKLYTDLIQAVWPLWKQSWQVGVADWK